MNFLTHTSMRPIRNVLLAAASGSTMTSKPRLNLLLYSIVNFSLSYQHQRHFSTKSSSATDGCESLFNNQSTNFMAESQDNTSAISAKNVNAIPNQMRKSQVSSGKSINTKFLIDTHDTFVKLVESGFTHEQSKAVIDAMKLSNTDIIDSHKQVLLSRLEFVEAMSDLKKRIDNIFIDVTVLRKGEMVTVSSEIDKLKLKIAGLTENFSGELNKMNSNLRLDLFEQKSINTGVNGAMEMNLSKLNNKIEVEVAMLRTLIQETQYSAIKFIIAMITSSATIGFAIYRLTH